MVLLDIFQGVKYNRLKTLKKAIFEGEKNFKKKRKRGLQIPKSMLLYIQFLREHKQKGS